MESFTPPTPLASPYLSLAHVTLVIQPIYFPRGALGSFQGPVKPRALASVAVFSFLQNASPLYSPAVLHLSDSETTEDETTEPQMETKEGSGRHQDKAGRRRASGIAAKVHQ